MKIRKRLLTKITPFADIFSSAGNVYRTAILFLLSEKPCTPSDIAHGLKISQPLAVHHIRILKKSGWITFERIGLHVYYTVNKKVLRQLIVFTNKFS